ncbi:hypothetical protein CEXT_813481 [Caerostris extrusa]|uniref:Uncharacterized protein n=1 Tax=Caerostris extrusa TaxID=172846 RepID=A0AAV4U0K0_CAEEX|nr:hypothetical protein CEXT_813481 [Caerostris extrusa]
MAFQGSYQSKRGNDKNESKITTPKMNRINLNPPPKPTTFEEFSRAFSLLPSFTTESDVARYRDKIKKSILFQSHVIKRPRHSCKPLETCNHYELHAFQETSNEDSK